MSASSGGARTPTRVDTGSAPNADYGAFAAVMREEPLRLLYPGADPGV